MMLLKTTEFHQTFKLIPLQSMESDSLSAEFLLICQRKDAIKTELESLRTPFLKPVSVFCYVTRQ